MSAWISVKERLPELYVTVLICNSADESTICVGFCGDDKLYYEHPEDSHNPLELPITHWMPLPPLPITIPETELKF